MKINRLLLAAGIIGPAVAIILTVADTVISPWFTWTNNALSDLGVHQYSYLFNYSLIFEGVMNFFFALGLYGAFRLRKSTVSALVISGAGLAMVGIFVETYHLYHLTFALLYFILFPVSIILFGKGIIKEHKSQALLGYVFSTISLVTIITGILIDFGAISFISIGLAIPEMIEATLLGIWSIYISAWTIRISQPGNMSAPAEGLAGED